MKKFFAILGLTLALMGCAKMQDSAVANGGWFTSSRGDYIIRNDSGGKIMDVWKLKNVIVQSEKQSDGWLFVDPDGNAVHLSGDIKIIRVNNMKDWDKYKEYHSEFEQKSYQELYSN
jgi:hypothetical protein